MNTPINSVLTAVCKSVSTKNFSGVKFLGYERPLDLTYAESRNILLLLLLLLLLIIIIIIIIIITGVPFCPPKVSLL
jgi:hypothetical protein